MLVYVPNKVDSNGCYTLEAEIGVFAMGLYYGIMS